MTVTLPPSTQIQRARAQRMVGNAPEEKQCAHCGKGFKRDKRNTYAYWERAKYCSSKCSGAAHSARATAKRPPMAEVFARWFDKGDGCWEWQGARDLNGYGAFSYACKTMRAHVVALVLDGRAPRKGQYACHTCDNPACVNPAHLYPGWPSDNVRDMIERGRNQHGSGHYAAKITEEDVRDIRASDKRAADLAAQYGVSISNIYMIRTGKTWKHVA